MNHRIESSSLIDSTCRIMPPQCATGFASDVRQRHRQGQWHTLTGVLALLLLTQIGRGRADEPASAQATIKAPRLELVFSDDFSTDTCGQYEVQGDVSWEKDKLTLAEGASITREINGDAWAQVKLDFGDEGWADNEETAELRIWFVLDGATNCFVRILRNPDADGEPVTSVALFDTGQRDGQLVAQLVREFQVAKAPVSRLVVHYRHGLVTATDDQSTLLTAYIENGAATVAGSRIQATGSFPGLNGWTVHSLPTSPSLTDERQQQAAEANAANGRLMELYRQGKFADAAKVGERVLSVRKLILGEEHPDYALSLNNLAALYKSMGEYARAEPISVQARDLRKKVLGEEHPSYARSLNNLAHLYTLMGEYSRAEPLFVQARDIWKKVLGEEHPDYAVSLNNLAELYRSMGEYARAEPLYVQARDIRKNVLGKEHPDYAVSLNNLAELYRSMGEYARAEPLYVQARDIRKNVLGKEHPDYAVSLNNLAALYESMGEYARAESLLVQARDITKKVLGEEHPDYAVSLNNLAELYRSMGEYARAEPLYVQARDTWKKVLGEEHPNYALTLNNLARLYHSMGKYARAEPLSVQARDISKKVLGERHPSYARSLNNLASLYESMGQYARAEPLYVQARELRKKVLGEEHPDYAASVNNLAHLYQSMGEYTRAEPLYVQARDMWKKVLGEEHPHYALSLDNLAAVYESMGEYARAEPLCLQAHRVLTAAATRAVPSLSEAQAGSWIRENSPPTDAVLAVLRRQQKWDAPAGYAAVWRTKGLVRRLRVGQSLASDASPAAHETFAELRDARLKLAKLVCATPSPEQAKDYRQALANASERKEVMEKKLAEVNTATAREIAVRDATVHDLQQRLGDGVAVVDFVKLDDWRYVDAEITLENEGGEVSTRTVKMPESYPVYDAFVLRGDRPEEANILKWVPLGSAEPIDASITAWRTELAPTTAASTTNAAASKTIVDADKRLRKLIWEKVEPHLDGIHTVVIIPDGNLHRLPWAALPGRNDGDYLIHDYALTTASSGQQLYGVLADPPIETPPRLLVAAGINYNQRPQVPAADSEPAWLAANSRPLMRSQEDFGWGRLPGTTKEAEAIVEFWGDRGDVKQLSGVQANEIALSCLLPQSTFAHLASHGFFDTRGEVYGTNLREQSLFESSISGSQSQSSVAYRNPLLMTGIVMAGANVPPETDDLGLPVGDDGILTAEEISDLDLRNTELVTLSACETGLGDVAAGQGVYGLTRALHKSGTRSVVASLWKVDDNATTELMKQFYTNLWQKKMSKLKALRKAQLTMLNRYDPTTGKLRGAFTGNKGKSDPNKAAPKPARAGERLDPRYWAAFQLSGDWR